MHGNSTLTVSLPSSWAKKLNIEKGDELDLKIEGDSLNISIEKKEIMKTKEFDAKTFERFARSYLTSSYIHGYNEISVKYDEAKYIETIRDILSKELVGFEIIKQGNKNCQIKNLSGSNQNQFENVLKRIFILLIDLSNEIIESLEKNDQKRLKNIHLMDSNINKFSNYCLRLLIKKGYSDYKKTPLYYHLIRSLEELGDRHKDLCNFYLKNKEKINEHSIEIFKDSNSIIKELYDLFYNYEKEKVEAIFTRIKTVQNKISKSSPSLEIYLSSMSKDMRDLTSLFVEMNL